MSFLAKGSRVLIDGLKAKPELNGTIGTVEGFSNESGRYAVRLESGVRIAVRRLSLSVADTPNAAATGTCTWAGGSGSGSGGADAAATDAVTLWLAVDDVPILASASGGAHAELGRLRRGEVVEAYAMPSGAARLAPSEAARLLSAGGGGGDGKGEESEEQVIARFRRQHEERRRRWQQRQNWDVKAFIRTEPPAVVAFGGRSGGLAGELWFVRSHFTEAIRAAAAAARAPVRPIAPPKRVDAAGCGEADTHDPSRSVGVGPRGPPLGSLRQCVDDGVIRQLVERGYAVVDGALPPSLCKVLRAEMEALEEHGQMWPSQTYGGSDGGGAAHVHVHETSLDFREVRRYAPTLAAIEGDPSLLELSRRVPGLGGLSSQHVRIQVNEGHGGCYTMHTDAGKRLGSPDQSLLLTALFYLNPDWAKDDGGELRVFPYPYAEEVISPSEGRLVLFEPRMVHDVLPNWKKRFCFTLWCSAQAPPQDAAPSAPKDEGEPPTLDPLTIDPLTNDRPSRPIDHATLRRLEVMPSIAEAAAVAEGWRRGAGRPIAYPASLPASLRAVFLPEMRSCLVRATHADDEINQLRMSHEAGPALDEAMRGVAMHHEMARTSNPRWLLNLLEQLPKAQRADDAAQRCAGAGDGGGDGDGDGGEHGDGGGGGNGGGVLRAGELRELAHRLAPWWN